MNPLYMLRDRMKLSRAQFGELVGKSEATIEKYESDISRQFASQLARLAKKHGHDDLVDSFKVAAGETRRAQTLDLAALASNEIAFLKACLSIYRAPANDYEKSVITIVRELIKLRRLRK